MKILLVGDGFIAKSIHTDLKESGATVERVTYNSFSGASAAAGAMINVECEQEIHTHNKPAFEIKHAFARKAAVKLRNFIDPDILNTGTKLIRTDSNNATKIEVMNYELLLETIGNPHNSIEEHSFDNELHRFKIPRAKYIDPTKINLAKKTLNGKKFDKIILAVGAGLNQIIETNVPVIYSKGIALKIKNFNLFHLDSSVGVFRTVNRGYECGFHAVRCKDSTYIGATSELMEQANGNHAEIIKVNSLLNTFMEKFNVIKYKNSYIEETYVGFRPFSTDGIPLIGEIKKDVYVVSGTNREGITISKGIAEIITKLITNNPLEKIEKDFLDICNPNRQPIKHFEDQDLIDWAEIMLFNGDTPENQTKVLNRLQEQYNCTIPEMLCYYYTKRRNLS